MSEEDFWHDHWGDLRAWIIVVIILLSMGALVGFGFGLTYGIQGCFINKGHMGPHISDGVYECQITDMKYPHGVQTSFLTRIQINGKTYTLRAEPSLGEQIWSQGVGGYITIWVKNNHVIKYHIGAKRGT